MTKESLARMKRKAALRAKKSSKGHAGLSGAADAAPVSDAATRMVILFGTSAVSALTKLPWHFSSTNLDASGVRPLFDWPTAQLYSIPSPPCPLFALLVVSYPLGASSFAPFSDFHDGNDENDEHSDGCVAVANEPFLSCGNARRRLDVVEEKGMKQPKKGKKRNRW